MSIVYLFGGVFVMVGGVAFANLLVGRNPNESVSQWLYRLWGERKLTLFAIVVLAVAFWAGFDCFGRAAK